ncbi:hypothetical protein D3C73_1176790 [compost metagenome]
MIVAPWPSTVESATPLSVAWLPITVDPAPVADAPKPPADASAPEATAWAVDTLLSDTNAPDLPLLMLVTAVSSPPIALPRFE